MEQNHDPLKTSVLDLGDIVGIFNERIKDNTGTLEQLCDQVHAGRMN